MKSIGLLVVLAATLWGTSALAQVYRCAGPDGSTVFSQQACHDGGAGEPVNATNRPPSGDSDYIPWGDVSALPDRQERSSSRVNVVGGGFKCSDLSAQEIRTATVQERALIGMNTKQLQAALGSPLTINDSSYGNDQWVYPGRLYIYVNKQGCVESWN
ncbi:MAG: DUF4124 domain-containing protein [Halopseudomonas sp.]|uniref:DUF4124 domain-containing protein n=1 Tax=Halopseudomonas sp. TaxID=2901191 RepID=UPI003002C554